MDLVDSPASPARSEVATHQPFEASEADQIEAGACAHSSGGTFENECATRGIGSKQSSSWSASEGGCTAGGAALLIEAGGAGQRQEAGCPEAGQTGQTAVGAHEVEGGVRGVEARKKFNVVDSSDGGRVLDLVDSPVSPAHLAKP
ncbi:hypothetical protein T484DRAFT_1880079 [Baffinella frigidus]|nr:hypothetical protein T484DRAFT_1880079 [Cryptophyta sp. CCMP2293]